MRLPWSTLAALKKEKLKSCSNVTIKRPWKHRKVLLERNCFRCWLALKRAKHRSEFVPTTHHRVQNWISKAKHCLTWKNASVLYNWFNHCKNTKQFPQFLHEVSEDFVFHKTFTFCRRNPPGSAVSLPSGFCFSAKPDKSCWPTETHTTPEFNEGQKLYSCFINNTRPTALDCSPGGNQGRIQESHNRKTCQLILELCFNF